MKKFLHLINKENEEKVNAGNNENSNSNNLKFIPFVVNFNGVKHKETRKFVQQIINIYAKTKNMEYSIAATNIYRFLSLKMQFYNAISILNHYNI